eukprot:m.351790 g.351790  ORF g.351790 m.351790 type:complete len:81 (-) comp16350_c0_seq1:201-443(-)
MTLLCPTLPASTSQTRQSTTKQHRSGQPSMQASCVCVKLDVPKDFYPVEMHHISHFVVSARTYCLSECYSGVLTLHNCPH